MSLKNQPMGLRDSCMQASMLFECEVVPVKNLHVLDKDRFPPDFFRKATRNGAASHYDRNQNKVYVYFQSDVGDMETAVAEKAIYALVAAKGPDAVLRNDSFIDNFCRRLSNRISPENARIRLTACTSHSADDLHMASLALESAGVVVNDATKQAFADGMRHYNGHSVNNAIQDKDIESLSALAKASTINDNANRVHFGETPETWSSIGYPCLNISIKREAFINMLIDSGFSLEDITKKNLIENIREPVAFLKEKNGCYKAVLPVIDKSGEFVTYSVHSPEQIKTFTSVLTISLRGFGHIHPEALIKRLSWKNEKDETNIVYLKKKNDSSFSYEMMNILRAIESDTKKRTPAIAGTFTQHDSTGVLKHDANLSDNSETAKKNEEISQEKTNPAERRVEAQDAAGGVLKLDAKIKLLLEPSKSNDNYFSKKTSLTPSEFDLYLERAAENVRKHRNPHDFDAVDESIAAAVNGADNALSVDNNPLSRPLDQKHFSFGERARLADGGIRTVRELYDAVLRYRDKGFKEKFGEKAWTSSLACMEAFGLLRLRMLRPLPVRLEAAAADFEGERLKNLRESLRALPKYVSQGVFAAPRGVDGTVFPESDMHYLAARIITTPHWMGCPVFATAQELSMYGLSPKKDAEPVLSKTTGCAVYNIADTDMHPALLAHVCEAAKADAKAIPAPVISYMVSVRTMTPEMAPAITAHLDATWEGLSPLQKGDKAGVSLEDVLFRARTLAEKDVDPKGILRKNGFPETAISELLDKGDMTYSGTIAAVRRRGVKDGQPRSVTVRLRIEDGAVRLCTPGGNPVGESLEDALNMNDLGPVTMGRIDRIAAATCRGVTEARTVEAPDPGDLQTLREYGVPEDRIRVLEEYREVTVDGNTYHRRITELSPATPDTPAFETHVRAVIADDGRIHMRSTATGKDLGSPETFFMGRNRDTRMSEKNDALGLSETLSSTQQKKR